ncbi:GNAT family N-acetyltransferase [Burkholderia cepacia]|uniref:GNAT family N-acetyltransferase n=1 Tax=Burkholderia cepacia TaxID=292 RepID=UPI00299D9FAB|nr:GNAT family N-acetyltransferase [Burkholderia cepacia]
MLQFCFFSHDYRLRVTRSARCDCTHRRAGCLPGHPVPAGEPGNTLDITSLKQSNALFAVARDSEGIAIGCGAIVLNPEFGELKRMYVSPRGWGLGISQKLIGMLEVRAIDSDCKLLKLETGPYQHEALALYASAGYERRGAVW